MYYLYGEVTHKIYLSSTHYVSLKVKLLCVLYIYMYLVVKNLSETDSPYSLSLKSPTKWLSYGKYADNTSSVIMCGLGT